MIRSENLTGLFSSLRSLKGVGARFGALLNKFFANGETQEAIVLDLLMHMPTQIIDRRAQLSIREAQIGSIATLKLHIDSHQKPPKNRPHSPYRVYCHDESGKISLVFFHVKGNWLERSLPIGEIRYVSGEIGFFNGEKQITHPDYIVKIEDFNQLPLVEPLYPLTHGLSSKALRKLIVQALEKLPKLDEWIEKERIEQFGWPDFSSAMRSIHAPKTPQEAQIDSAARMRLAYDEYLAGQLSLQIIRSNLVKQKGVSRKFSGKITNKINNILSFELTRGQKIAIREIIADLESNDKMSRLLQGDVGAGKTIVAFFAMAAMAEVRTQSALMAPTDILANQHYKTLKPLCEQVGLTITILSGKMKAGERKKALEEIKSGKSNIIVGTHALFQSEVEFNNLGLTIIDEQHRFGVYQRLALSEKGKNCDMLVMSATPIPRSLVLTHFGDMDVSILREKPAGRKAIKTAALPIEKYDKVIMRLKAQIESGAQAFWVCPLVEESEIMQLVSAQERFLDLQKYFGDKVALVHGRLGQNEKQQIMQDFQAGKYKILVATTVIEVGVDVPNASIMIIEHAERFGLAQLHQLRGRVGRSDKESACLLLYKPPLGEIAKARLDIICKSEDGFEIAQRDLELRGQGDILGTRQSGMPGYKIVVPDIHRHLLEYAHQDAKKIIKNNPYLSGKQGEALRSLLYIFRKDSAIPLIRAG